MPRSKTDATAQDLKIRVLGLLRRLDEGLAAAAGDRREALEDLDERTLRAYLAALEAEDGAAYLALMDDLRDLLESGLDPAAPARSRASGGAGSLRRGPDPGGPIPRPGGP